MLGKAFEPWLVRDGKREHGPYATKQVIAMLRSGQISWDAKLWRAGIKAWSAAARLADLDEVFRMTKINPIRIADYAEVREGLRLIVTGATERVRLYMYPALKERHACVMRREIWEPRHKNVHRSTRT